MKDFHSQNFSLLKIADTDASQKGERLLMLLTGKFGFLKVIQAEADLRMML